MKAGEIRQNLGGTLKNKNLDEAMVMVLIEIAAQLAEANDLARFELGFDEEKVTDG